MKEGSSWQLPRAAVRIARKPERSITSKRAKKPRRNWSTKPQRQKPRRVRIARKPERSTTSKRARKLRRNWSAKPQRQKPRRLRTRAVRQNPTTAPSGRVTDWNTQRRPQPEKTSASKLSTLVGQHCGSPRRLHALGLC